MITSLLQIGSDCSSQQPAAMQADLRPELSRTITFSPTPESAPMASAQAIESLQHEVDAESYRSRTLSLTTESQSSITPSVEKRMSAGTILPPLSSEDRDALRRLRNEPRREKGITKPFFDPKAPRHALQVEQDTSDWVQGRPMQKTVSFAMDAAPAPSMPFRSFADFDSEDPEVPGLKRDEEEHLAGGALDRHESTQTIRRIGSSLKLEGWDYIQAIPESALLDLAGQFAPIGTKSVHYVESASGMHNLVHIVRFLPSRFKYCIRIPCCGSPSVWNGAARATLRNCVDTMTFLRFKTNMRIPAVKAWNDGLNNPIKAPYIMMECVEGTPVDKVWWEDDRMERTKNFVTVPPALEEKRQNILRSIAEQMAELRNLRFEGRGAFKLVDGDVEKPLLVESKMIPFAYVLEDYQRKLQKKQESRFILGSETATSSQQSSLDSSRSRMSLVTSSVIGNLAMLSDWYDEQLQAASDVIMFIDPAHDRRSQFVLGLYCLYEIMLQCLPFASNGRDIQSSENQREAFVLAQTDFQPQNIFVDDYGNVTGFIDWDYSTTKPQYNGWSRMPWWLCDEWDPEMIRQNQSGLKPFPSKTSNPWCESKRYQRDYARYLIEACEADYNDNTATDDWRFSLKSPMFDMITQAIGDTENMTMALYKIFHQHIGNYNWEEHVTAIGREGFMSYPGLKRWYTSFFRKLFNCDPYAVKAELHMLDSAREVHKVVRMLNERSRADRRVCRFQQELIELYKAQLAAKQEEVTRLSVWSDKSPPSPLFSHSKGHGPPVDSQYPSTVSGTDVSWHSWNSQSSYYMGGANRPHTPPCTTHEAKNITEGESTEREPQSTSANAAMPLWKTALHKLHSRYSKWRRSA